MCFGENKEKNTPLILALNPHQPDCAEPKKLMATSPSSYTSRQTATLIGSWLHGCQPLKECLYRLFAHLGLTQSNIKQSVSEASEALTMRVEENERDFMK